MKTVVHHFHLLTISLSHSTMTLSRSWISMLRSRQLQQQPPQLLHPPAQSNGRAAAPAAVQGWPAAGRSPRPRRAARPRQAATGVGAAAMREGAVAAEEAPPAGMHQEVLVVHPGGCTRRCSWPRQRRASGHRLLEPTRAPPLARPPRRSAPPAEATSPPRSPAAGAPPSAAPGGGGGALSGVLTPPAPHCSFTAPYPEPQVLQTKTLLRRINNGGRDHKFLRPPQHHPQTTHKPPPKPQRWPLHLKCSKTQGCGLLLLPGDPRGGRGARHKRPRQSSGP